MAICAVPSVMAKDPRFQALKEAYKDRHYNDDHLAQALQLCREYHGYDDQWFPETPARKGVFTRFLNFYLTYSKMRQTESDMSSDKLYNLYTTLYAVYTPEQLDARVSMIARRFGEILSELERSTGGKYSRQEILNHFSDDKQSGFLKVMDRIFDEMERYTDPNFFFMQFVKDNPNATKIELAKYRKTAEYRAGEYKTLLANKERLAALAATKIGDKEGLVVNIRNFEISFEEPEDEDVNDQNKDDDDGEDAEEGSKGDRYGDYRTLKLMNTLSVRARRLLDDVEKVDSNGKPVYDDIGCKQYIGGRQAAVTLNKVLVNSTPETMMADLEAAAEFYPWISGLVRKLRSDTDLQRTVYNNFKKAETTYIYTNLDAGRYVTKIANSRAQGWAMLREAGTNMQGGYELDHEYSLYTEYGALVSKDKLEKIREKYDALIDKVKLFTASIRMVAGDKRMSPQRVQERVDKIREQYGQDASYLLSETEFGAEAMQKFLDANPDVPETIARMLRGQGFSVSADDIKAIAMQDMTAKGWNFVLGHRDRGTFAGRNKLYQLVSSLPFALSRAEEIYEKGLPQTGQYLFNTCKELQNVNRCLALAQYLEVEPRVVNEGKSLSAYNNMNLLHQQFDLLANSTEQSDEEYEKTIEDEYLQYEGYTRGMGKQRTVHGWLKKLLEGHGRDAGSAGRQPLLRVIDSVGFNHIEYAKLSRQQKLTSSLLTFLQAGAAFQAAGKVAVEVPIQSDYSTAYNFILAPSYTEEEIIEELTDETLMELDRIAAIKERINDDNRVKLSVYEEQGMKLTIFPALNDTSFIEDYAAAQSEEEARKIVRDAVVGQLEGVIALDTKTINDSGILMNKALNTKFKDWGDIMLYAEDGKIESLSEKAQGVMRHYFLNVFYARQQITKLLVGGTAQFNGLVDFEKRNMLMHATRTSLYTQATWNGKRVTRIAGKDYKNSKDSQNVVYIGDDTSTSAFLDDIKEMLKELVEAKVISQSQYDTMIDAYSKIKTTDGQGFRTLESYRMVQIMADQWDQRHEIAFRHIVQGKPTKKDIDVFMQNIKPVVTGYEKVPAAVGENQKPVKLTVLHKYSEQVLLPMALAQYCLQTQSVPLQALENAQQKLKAQGKEIDMFLFHSGVKVGAHSILQPFAKDKTTGERILKDAKSIEDYIVNNVLSKDSTMHTIPFKYYGIAASTQPHVADDKIAWASQAEKVAWANVVREHIINVRGKGEMSAWDARELYNQIKAADIIESYQRIRDFFTDTDELERVFQEELANKPYSAQDMKYALAHLKDGTFATPLFSPNIEHQIQEMLSSIIKKRMTKPKRKGANILQATGLGMDVEASSFDNKNALSEDDKLHVVFEGKGKNKRIKYVEVYIPIHDSRLKMFADENGNIGRERLNQLVAEEVIPESMLEFIAYRTPSDAEHSVIPCRIKGFVANTGGATIMMPKEIMVMTGHDYDGDKMRCHFKNFRMVDKEGEELNLSDVEIANLIVNRKLSGRSIDAAFQKCEVYQYNYDIDPLKNTQQARENARVDLMFAQLTSPDGSRRVLIPGGCTESSIIARTMYLVRSAKDKENQKKIADNLVDIYIDKEYNRYQKSVKNPPDKDQWIKKNKEKIEAEADRCHDLVRRTTSLYNELIKHEDGELMDITRVISSNQSPFSMTHSVDAYEYIMTGSEMIGIYAKYNSALQMLQRLYLSYIPKRTEKGYKWEIKLFGKKFDKLFDVKNHRGRLASLGLARLLNAAVDNNKNPILGYLNQTKEMADMTFFLFANGITEEEIHLIMNQPAVIKLNERLKSRDSKGFVKDAQDIVDELSGGSDAFNPWNSVKNVANMSREDFIRNLSLDFDDLKKGENVTSVPEQIDILNFLIHLNAGAETLKKFVDLTRPETESGAIGTTLADIITKVTELNEFREELNQKRDDELRIFGMREVLAKRDIGDASDPEYLMRIIGNELPEVVALNTLMLDSTLEMFIPYFPQARASWIKMANEIVSRYNIKSKKKKARLMEKVMSEMVAYKLLQNKDFSTGDTSEEQRRILIDVPKHLWDLKDRINEAEKKRNQPREVDENGNLIPRDTAAEALIGNSFLSKLTTTSPENSREAPRIQFTLNGPAVEGTRDLISSSWNAMLASGDKSIRDLAIDLYKYNLYTNGFSYGMYEFSHFAPFSVIMSTPKYIDALRQVLSSDWGEEGEFHHDNFYHYYCMNHWGDEKFLIQMRSSKIKTSDQKPDELKDQIWVSPQNDKKMIDWLSGMDYIVLLGGENNKVQTLYRVERGNEEIPIVLVKAPKLGVRNRHGQVTLQYNPSVDYHYAKPVVAGNDSAWGPLDEINDPWAEANYNAEDRTPRPSADSDRSLRPPGMSGSDYFMFQQGLSKQKERMEKLEEKAKKNVEQHKSYSQKEDNSSPVRHSDSRREWGVRSDNGYEVSSSGDKRFSALFAKFKAGTVVDGVDVGRKTIEYVYQNIIKKSGKGRAPAKESRLYNPSLKTKAERENFSYNEAYLPLWRIWAEQNPELIEDLRKKSTGKVITDKFASNTTVSQARALAQILDETEPVATSEIVSVDDIPETQANSVTPPVHGVRRPFMDGLGLGAIRDVDPIKESKEVSAQNGFMGMARPEGLKPLDDEIEGTTDWPISDIDGVTSDTENYSLSDLAAYDAMEAEEAEYYKNKKLQILRQNEDGEYVSTTVPATPAYVKEARRQKVFVELNKRLREILREKGVAIGTLTSAEARMALGGITDFDTASVTAQGLVELIRLANGQIGEEALPEEFAHVALEMLGHDHPLVQRLLNILRNNREAMEEAYDGMYGEYERRYGEDNVEDLVTEAAGKLVAKALFMEQEIQTSPIRRLVHRIVEAIKAFFRRFRRDEIQNAIFDSYGIASKIAREMLGGQLLDQMEISNITQSGQFLKVQRNLNDKDDILSKLLKTEIKRYEVLKRRYAYKHKNPKETPASIAATELQIKKLDDAIKNYKTEEAIVTYMNDSLLFLKETNKMLTDAISSGQPVNSICRKLNTVRDTLFSFAQSIKDINEAITDKEILDNVNLKQAISDVSSVLASLNIEYERYAKQYFKEMLSSVYGEEGLTVTIGKDRGRKITIDEMASKADRDISFFSRWFHAIADCDDYVLKAIDDITRSAKMRARDRARDVRPQIEVAMADLIKETGSRDQSFMFEYERGKDGKMHRTGKYISEEASKALSPAKKRFYDTMMKIKDQADACVPESLLDDRKIIMMRKYTMDRFKDAEGAKGKALEAWDGLKNRVMESGDVDYENYEVAVDFEGNQVDMLPVKFLMKGKNESYDDMTDDVAMSMMAYAGMAFEFDELNGVIGILENAKYMASERDITQRAGRRTKRESIGYKPDGTIDEEAPGYYRQPFTTKQAYSLVQDALNDFFQMHIYGHIRKNEGTIGNTRLSKRKVIDTINSITSLSQMALNLPQRIANVNTGLTQIIIESAGKGYFNMKDVTWASAVYMKESGDRLAETGKTDYDNKLSLWADLFDVHQTNGRYDSKYKKSDVSRAFNGSLLYAGLQMGEDYLALTTSLALARNFKVKAADGKTTNLWDAYEVKYTDPVNKRGAHLEIKKGYAKEDGTPITKEDEMRFAKLTATMNFEMQGIYNLDDRSAIQQYCFGALIIMYRKWIAPALKRRYGKTQYNVLKGDYQEGYQRTLFRLLHDVVVDAKDQVTEEKSNWALLNIIDDVKAVVSSWKLNYDKMTAYEKANVKRASIELGIVTGLWVACALLGKIPPPEDPNGERGKLLTWWDKTIMSQMLRLRTEIGSQAPTPALVGEALKILKSPFAAIEPMQNILNVLQLLYIPNYFTEIKHGRYAGHTKAYKYFWNLPILSMKKKVDNFFDPSSQINYYKSKR